MVSEETGRKPEPAKAPKPPREATVIDQERRRIDAEAALSDLYERTLHLERELRAARDRVAEVEAHDLYVEEQAAIRSERIAELESECTRMAHEIIEMHGERERRIAAEQEVVALYGTKVFRYAQLPRRVWGKVLAVLGRA